MTSEASRSNRVPEYVMRASETMRWANKMLELLDERWEVLSDDYRRSTMRAVRFSLDPVTNPRLDGWDNLVDRIKHGLITGVVVLARGEDDEMEEVDSDES